MTCAGVEAVLFDLGGVLVEVDSTSCLSRWRGAPVTRTEVTAAVARIPEIRAFETGRVDAGVFAEAVIAELRLSVSRATFLAAFRSWVSRGLPGSRDLLERVRATGRTAACLSNTNHLHWERICDELAFGNAFDRAFLSFQTGHFKPELPAFLDVPTALGCRPEAVVFLDDSEVNVTAACAAGLRGVCVGGPAEASAALVGLGVLS